MVLQIIGGEGREYKSSFSLHTSPSQLSWKEGRHRIEAKSGKQVKGKQLCITPSGDMNKCKECKKFLGTIEVEGVLDAILRRSTCPVICHQS